MESSNFRALSLWLSKKVHLRWEVLTENKFVWLLHLEMRDGKLWNFIRGRNSLLVILDATTISLSFQTQQSADEAQVILRGWSFNRKLLSKFELDFTLVIDIYCFDHNRILFGLCLNSWKSIFYLHLAKLITAVSFFYTIYSQLFVTHKIQMFIDYDYKF